MNNDDIGPPADRLYGGSPLPWWARRAEPEPSPVRLTVAVPEVHRRRAEPAKPTVGRALRDEHRAEVEAHRQAEEGRRFATLQRELRAGGIDASVNTRTTSAGTRYELTVPQDQEAAAGRILDEMARAERSKKKGNR